MEDSPPSEASLKDSLKKRPRSDVDGGGNGGGDRRNPESKVTTTTTRNTLSNIRRLRLEAIFYPKFDNEKQDHSNNNTNNKNDDDNNKNQQKLIRQQMIQRVADRKGYLEVTLKHSGSLVLWSGGTQRFYSKNSTSNQFTLVAEILLRQHMERAWRTTTTLVQEEGDGGNNVGLVKYQELCDYLQEHRYTIAFEVVAAVLGDHGDIPHKDFLIATAVADRPNERFLSTVEVITFCQNFHLPHNDTWAFTTRDGTEHLFQLYDTCRETGLATDTICALSESAQAHVASMYPHSIFQGEILEGFVIRYIEYPKVHDQEQQHEHDNEREEEKIEPLQRQIQGLAVTAQQILQEVPPSLPPSFEVEDDTESILFKTDIRKLFQEMDGPRLGLNAGEAFSQVLEKVLSTEDGGTQMRRTTERIPSKDFDLPSITASLRSSKDVETRRIAEMLHTVGSLSKLVSYKLLEEQSPSMMTSSSSSSSSTTATTTRTLCIIHVLHDQTFFKYHRVKNDDTMDLFRGFCVELGTEEEDLDASTVPDNSDVVAMDCDGDGGSGTKEEKPSSLMLKMKLLPYMIRTFICRNRLNVIEQDGPAAFVTQARKQFRMWSISEQATLKHMPFLEQWANYAKSQMSGVTTTATTEQGLPPLSSFSYLKHLEYFQTQFEQEIRLGTFKEAFQGFACIVALKEETAKIAACAVADRLNDDAVAEVLSLKDAMNGCRMRGVICYGVLDDYSLKIRNFLGDVQRYSTIALLGCSEEEIEQQLSEPTKVKKKWKALSQRWSQELAQSHLSFPMSVMSGDTSSSLEYLDTAVAAITQAATCAPWNEESWDARPGVVVFFPGIPGSGKSSLVGSKQKELNEFLASNNGSEMRRNVDVLVGDELGKSFWTTVKTIRSKNAPSAVTVLDKNTPPSSWRIVGDVCSSTNAFPLAVFPDSSSLKTTRICGMKSPGGSFRPEKSHFYPFSLEYLAICVARVLQRPPSTHIGQLDSGSKIAAMIVVMFYTFYRYSSAEDLRDDIDRTLKGAGALDSLEPIQVPFVSETTTTGEFPVEILQTLEEALQLLVRDTGSKKP